MSECETKQKVTLLIISNLGFFCVLLLGLLACVFVDVDELEDQVVNVVCDEFCW